MKRKSCVCYPIIIEACEILLCRVPGPLIMKLVNYYHSFEIKCNVCEEIIKTK